MTTKINPENFYIVSTPNWIELDSISETELNEDKIKEIHGLVLVYLQEYLKGQGYDENHYSLDIKIYLNVAFDRYFHLSVTLSHFSPKPVEGVKAVGPKTGYFSQGFIIVPPKPGPPAPLSFRGFQEISEQFKMVSHITTVPNISFKSSDIIQNVKIAINQ